MSNSRASIFDTDDLASFTPKAGPVPDALPPEQIRAITEASNFPSREPKARTAPQPAPAKPAKAEEAPRPAAPPKARKPIARVRTYRDQQLNARASAQTVEDFYALASEHGWSAAETLERAVAALKRDTAGKGRAGA